MSDIETDVVNQDDAILDLATYRKQRTAQPLKHTATVEAVGHNKIAMIQRLGEHEVRRYVFSAEGADLFWRHVKRAMRDARAWSTPPCPGCGEKLCHKWHDGQLLERNEYSGDGSGGVKVRYWVDGATPKGAHRLRAMDGGKLRYSRASSPHYWGRVVGFVAVDADKARTPKKPKPTQTGERA